MNQKFATLRDYTLVGLLATATHYSLLYILVDVLHLLDPVRASIIGFLAGAAIGFVFNNNFVFKQPAMRVTALSKYSILLAINCVNNAVLMYIMINKIGVPYLIAQLIATSIIYMTNYIICKSWIFNEQAYVK